MVESGKNHSLEIGRQDEITDFLLSHAIDRDELVEVGRLVALGLRLHSKAIRPATASFVNGHLTSVIYYASRFLDIPIPNKIDFIHGRKAKPSRGRRKNNSLYVAAESSSPKKFPDGEIGYSAYYLDEHLKVVDRKFGPDRNHDIHPFVILSAHEVRHLKQRTDSPSQLDIDIHELETKGLGAWGKTPSEKEAERFSIAFANAYLNVLPQINPLRQLQIIGA